MQKCNEKYYKAIIRELGAAAMTLERGDYQDLLEEVASDCEISLDGIREDQRREAEED